MSGWEHPEDSYVDLRSRLLVQWVVRHPRPAANFLLWYLLIRNRIRRMRR